jgi:hypothetical protein
MPSAEEIAEGLIMLSPQNIEFDIQHIETKRKWTETGYVEGWFSSHKFKKYINPLQYNSN